MAPAIHTDKWPLMKASCSADPFGELSTGVSTLASNPPLVGQFLHLFLPPFIQTNEPKCEYVMYVIYKHMCTLR